MTKRCILNSTNGGSEGFNFWERYTDDKGLYNASVGIYTLIRDINNLLETIPTLNTSNNKKTLLRVKLLFYVHIHILLWQSGMVEFDYQESSGV